MAVQLAAARSAAQWVACRLLLAWMALALLMLPAAAAAAAARAGQEAEEAAVDMRSACHAVLWERGECRAYIHACTANKRQQTCFAVDQCGAAHMHF